jgi:hypothetical protein
MKSTTWCMLGTILLLAGCGPSPEEQHAMDQQKCDGFGFPPGSDAFANCMMKVTQQREADQAANQRAAAARAAAEQRANDAEQAAARSKAASEAPSSSSSGSSPFGPSPVDQVRDSIQKDLDNVQNAQ